jgi:nicotinate-nucleotide pyrophosphorylase
VAAARVNFISVGALTHSAPAVDIHLRLIKTWKLRYERGGRGQ